jgi:hypothetical protein
VVRQQAAGGRLSGALWALLLIAAALAWQLRTQAETLALWDRYVQPGFDARVYMAMADAPGFFTLPPWGLRVLTPALVHVLARPASAEAFLGLALGALMLAGMLFYGYLRALGHARWGALLGVLALGFSPPVADIVAAPFLTEALQIALLIGLLWALEARAPSGVLALLGVLGVLDKEAFLGFAIGAACFEWLRRGTMEQKRIALTRSLALLLPAVATYVLLRKLWVPYLTSEASSWPGSDVFWLAVYRVLAGVGEWGGAALLLGVTPLALLGACRAVARPFLRRMSLLLLFALALPFAASVFTEDRTNVPFFAADIPRLLLYALPVLIHLALVAIDRVWPLWQPRVSLASYPRWLGPLGLVAAGAVLAVCLTQLDPYRRVDLRGPRDGRLVLALCRQSLEFGRRLEVGRPVAYDIALRRFEPSQVAPRYLERMRWFLRTGFGLRPHYQMGPPRMQEPVATLLLPCLRPDDWTLTLRLRSTAPILLEVAVNGRELATLTLEPGDERYRVEVPKDALFRGDNELRLHASLPGIEVADLRVQPKGGARP